jgi:hypothetical protein
MPACAINKIDSNVTGLRYAVEDCFKVLPVTPNWIPLEPNSYGDFGAKITSVSRNPINPSRQKQKGVTTGLEATADFEMDLTHTNHLHFMQGYLFAVAREKPTTAPLNAAVIPTTAVATADSSYAMSAPTAALFKAGHVFRASGFVGANNNGIKVAGTPIAGKVVSTTALTIEASPPATANLQVIGFQFPSADVSIVMNGSIPRLTASVTVMTGLGLIPGEWVQLGGDLTAETFAVNKGFARIGAITATYIEFDKVTWASPGAEAGTGKTIRLYMGTVVKNENTPSLIVRQSYQFERTLGSDANGTMAQYVIGAVPNELSIDIKQEDKITSNFGFVAADSENKTGLDGLKSGTRPTLSASTAFNSSDNLPRISLSVLDALTAVPTPLVAFVTDVSLKIGNGVTGMKAVGILGSFDTNAGQLDITGSVTAYFQDMRAIKAVRNNDSITMDVILSNNNTGIVFDIPLLTLGNGLPKVEQDKPITVPLDTMAVESAFGHTLLYVNFPYLPTVVSP